MSVIDQILNRPPDSRLPGALRCVEGAVDLIACGTRRRSGKLRERILTRAAHLLLFAAQEILEIAQESEEE